MSQVTARINLSAKTFPFVAQNWGRTVIVPQYDTNFSRQLVSPADQDHDIGIPQAYYMHNVMPHAQGFQSIGYTGVVAKHITETHFLYRLNLIDDAGNSAILGICSNGNWYAKEPSTPWTLVNTSTSFEQVYTAYCSGVTYIYQHPGIQKKYNWGTHTLDNYTLGGLDGSLIVGITESYGYLVAWSKPTTAGVFTGAIVTGDLFITVPVVGPGLTPTGLIGAPITNANLPAGTFITSVTGPSGGNYIVGISLPATGTNAATVFNVGAISGGVFWSSTLDPTDFVPSLITGAGGGAVQEAQGPITVCVAHTKGFFIYTQNNCVVALYTANVRFPFAFQAIVASGGVSDPNLVTFDANTNLHYAYTTSGLQLIGINAASTVSPEITDFISGKLFEDFNDNTKLFTLTPLTTPLLKHIQVISSRYLVISYGVLALTHALVIDLVSQRVGKLKVNHVECFELPAAVTGVTELPRQNIAFLQTDGTVQVVNFGEYASSNATNNGTLFIGKFQFIRARNLILDSIILENVPDPSGFTLTVMTALSGKTLTATIPFLAQQDNTQQKYDTRVEGVNHSLLLQGRFHIESGVLVFHIGGKR